MQKSSLPKNQHFVPQFILKNFGINGSSQVHVFDKKRETTFVTSVRNVAAENGFYNVEHDGSFFSVEHNLSRLEAKASEVVNRIINNQSLADLSHDDKRWLSFFIAAQFARGKQFRSQLEQWHDFIADKIREMGFDPNDVEGLNTSDDSFVKKVSVFGLKENILKFKPYILDKTWILFKAPESMLHFISDNPVTLQNKNDFSPFGSLGLGVKGIEIYFPLSSHLSLGIFCDSHKTKIRSDFSRYIQIKKAGLLDSKQIPPYKIAALKRLNYGLETGNAIPSRAENVTDRNSLQVMQSFRFVFSSDGNFDLIREMIKHDPEYKEPPKIQIL